MEAKGQRERIELERLLSTESIGSVHDDPTMRESVVVELGDGRPASPALLRENSKFVKQTPPPPTNTVVVALWLLGWMINNIGVTLLNKAAFQFADFQYPYTLSMTHMAVNTLGAGLYLRCSPSIPRKQVNPRGQMMLAAFSLLFALNIAVGNNSLRYVSVNFNQVMRSLVPGVTMLLSVIAFRKTYSYDMALSLIPIVLGVAMAVYGELEFTMVGLIVTSFCVILSALKVALSGEMMTGEMKLHPVDLLSRMAPMSFVWMFLFAAAAGELTELNERFDEIVEGNAIPVVLTSALGSFSLNFFSLQANKATSPLTMTVAANVKQIIIIIASTLVFATPMAFMNATGIFVVLCGSARYSYVSYSEKQAVKFKAGTVLPPTTPVGAGPVRSPSPFNASGRRVAQVL